MKKSSFILLLMSLVSCRDGGIKEVPKCIPTTEVCDGFDNDCDGKVDNIIRTCKTACSTGTETCLNGSWLSCTAAAPKQEVCDGIDNDCNGLVDDNIKPEACYPGDIAEVGFGECRYGVLRCIDGIQQCIGAVTPVSETCDGLDNDCDGRVDNSGGISNYLDLVVAIDYSNSMDTKMPSIVKNLLSFLDAYKNRSDIRIAMLAVPGWAWTDDGQVKVLHDFQSVNNFIAYLGTLPVTNLNTGVEPTVDAIKYVADPLNPLHLLWSNNAKKILTIFSDEIPQSVETPAVTLSTAMSLAKTNQLEVYVFTDLGIISFWKTSVVNTFVLDPVVSNTAMQNVLATAAAVAFCK